MKVLRVLRGECAEAFSEAFDVTRQLVAGLFDDTVRVYALETFETQRLIFIFDRKASLFMFGGWENLTEEEMEEDEVDFAVIIETAERFEPFEKTEKLERLAVRLYRNVKMKG